jgi:hypothetical protein
VLIGSGAVHSSVVRPHAGAAAMQGVAQETESLLPQDGDSLLLAAIR